MVKVIGCRCDALVPNAFSPNMDGVNDYFFPQFGDCEGVSNYTMSIYNRFGQRVYSGFSPQPGWDGTDNGAALDVGTYFYYLQYVTPKNKVLYKKGDVVLIR
jgi:gliding motility-associated-like protein